MARLSISGLGFVFMLAACTGESPNQQGGTGGGAVGVAGGARGGSAGQSSSTGGSKAGTGMGTLGGAGGGNPAAGTGGASSGAGGAGGAFGTLGGAGSGASAGMGQPAGGAGTGAIGVTGGLGGMGGAGQGGDTGGAGGSTNVTVNLGQTRQTMVGFGLNSVWSDAYTDQLADLLFDPTKGIGLSILRIGMEPTGDPTGGQTWDDVKKAKARGVTTFIASVWTAPADCKDNDEENGGGHLLKTCYDSWSSTIAAFPAKVKQNAGVDLYAMSPSNEPDFASCGFENPCNGNYKTMLFNDQEMVEFVNKLGPKLHGLNPPVKLIAPEPSEWIHLWTNLSAPGSTDPLKGKGYDYGHALAKDTGAWALVDIIGTHQYDTQVAEPWPSDVPQTKPVFQTEMSGVKWWPEEGPSKDINNGVAVAGWIHDAIVNGPASAWLWWWLQASSTNDNEGLLLQDGTKTRRLYTVGNFSKFIRPGYVRVDVTGSIPAGVLLSGYLGADGTVVVVAINQGAADASVPISIAGGTAPASLIPNVTSATDDLVAKPAVTVSAGSFTAMLAGKTVTTFVGK